MLFCCPAPQLLLVGHRPTFQPAAVCRRQPHNNYPAAPVRAPITGNAADASACKIQTLWNSRTTAPCVHNNCAMNPDELMNHFHLDFNFAQNIPGIPGFGTTDQEKSDIWAYPELISNTSVSVRQLLFSAD
jgi:hypothetical protein